MGLTRASECDMTRRTLVSPADVDVRLYVVTFSPLKLAG